MRNILFWMRQIFSPLCSSDKLDWDDYCQYCWSDGEILQETIEFLKDGSVKHTYIYIPCNRCDETGLFAEDED